MFTVLIDLPTNLKFRNLHLSTFFPQWKSIFQVAHFMEELSCDRS